MFASFADPVNIRYDVLHDLLRSQPEELHQYRGAAGKRLRVQLSMPGDEFVQPGAGVRDPCVDRRRKFLEPVGK